ncbi:putative sodium-coupled neutral amino acid transporter 10 [Cetorhinus maximus]
MTASNWGFIMNVVNSIVGVSVLTMPFCFKQCGIALGVVLLLFCSWMTHQSCMFLVKAANTSKRRTYPGLAFHAYGKAGKMLVETSLIGLMLGTCIAFYVVIADLGSNFFAHLLGLQATQGFRVFLLFAVSLFIVLPLSLQRNMMASIQSFSAMALIFYTLFMFVIVLSSFKHGLFNGQWLSRVSYVRWEGFFQCIPIYGMSFACQSQVLPTYDSLDEPSVKRMSTIFSSALNVVNMFYITVGSFGYIGYLDNIAGNVMMNFPSNLVTEMIRVGFMMSVAVGFPMMILPCRQALNTFLFEQLQQKDGTFTAGGYMPPLRFKLITAGIVFGTMLGGILIPNVETILGLTGATMGSLICFVCPALIYRKIQKNGFTAQIILWVGLVILVISTFTTLTATSEQPVTPEKPPQDINHEKLQNEMDQQQKISVQNSVLKEAGDDRDRLKLEKGAVEQPQIKVPIEPPEESNDKGAEVQLDRPNQGVAHPVGEAHRHEPPIPHDEVIVDEGKDGDESNEKELPAMKAKQPNDEKQEGKINFDEKMKELEEKKMVNPGLKEQGKEMVNHINDAPAVDSKQRDQPGKMAPEMNVQGAVPQPGVELHQQKLNDNHGKVPGGEDAVIHNPEGNVENMKNKELENGNKRDLPALENVGAAEVLQPHVRDERDSENVISEEKQDGKPAEGGEDDEKHMDHIVLLNVIKEQQEQQKRLLDQQEKLLAVIQEQHKEIHQQRADDEDKGQQDGENPAKEQAGKENEDQVKNVDSMNGQKAEKPNADSQGDAPKLGQDLPAADHDKDDVEPKDTLQEAQGNVPENQDQNHNSKQDGEIGANVEAHKVAPQSRDKFKEVIQKIGTSNLLSKGKEVERVVPQPDAKVPKVVQHDEGAKASHEHGVKNPNVPLENEVKVEREGPEAGNRNPNVPNNGAKVPKISEDLGIKAKSKDEVHKIDSKVDTKPLKAEQVKERGSDEKNGKVKVRDRGAFQEKPNQPGGHIEDGKEKIHRPVNAGKVQGGNFIDRAEELDERKIEEDAMKSQRKEKVLDENIDLQHVDPNAPPKHKEKNPSQKDGEPYKDLKLDGGGDLRRRKRDLRSSMDESYQDDSGKLIISLDPVPNFKTDNLRSALESQLKQVAGASFQIVQSRQIKQVTDTEKDT